MAPNLVGNVVRPVVVTTQHTCGERSQNGTTLHNMYVRKDVHRFHEAQQLIQQRHVRWQPNDECRCGGSSAV